MNIHRINWLWGSTKAMAEAGINSMPKNWAEFNADCDKAVAAKLICLAHFSQDWTDATTFEIVVYGQNIDLFRKAFVQGDTEAMRSPEMIKAFEQMRLMVSKYMDPAIAGRDYDTATGMIAKGKAVFMIMGDWQIGIFTAAGLKEGSDYQCAQAPTDWGKPGFILNSDSVVFFKQTDPDYVAGQTLLAHLIMTPKFQTVFNQAKGSIPARMDVDLSKGFNPCQQLSQKALQASIADGTLVRSMAHNMTVLQKYRGAMMDTITSFVNNPKMTPKEAARRDGRRGRSAEIDRHCERSEAIQDSACRSLSFFVGPCPQSVGRGDGYDTTGVASAARERLMERWIASLRSQ